MRRVQFPRAAARLFAFIAACAVCAGCASSGRPLDVASEYFNLGNAYFELAQFDKAVSSYRTALGFNPQHAGARLNMALALIQLKKAAEAEEILAKLLAEDEKNVTVMTALGWALHTEGKEEEALKQYDRIAELSPENYDALYNGALILWKLDRKTEALDRFKKLLAVSPDDNEALFSAGALLTALDDPAAASEYLERYLQKKPEDKDALFLLAENRIGLKKYSQALAAYEKIAVLDPQDARAWFGKARLLLTVIEDPDKGVSALKQSLELGFKDLEAVKVLLASADLQNRQEVESLLKARNMLPQASAPEAEKK